jgi:hypothetical protein
MLAELRDELAGLGRVIDSVAWPRSQLTIGMRL